MSKTYGESPINHPKKGEHGEVIIIRYPTKPSDATAWHDSSETAVFVPNGTAPSEMNGVSIRIWEDAPRAEGDWEVCGLLKPELIEPPAGKSSLPWASGIVIAEPDGRVWMVSPTNKFGGYETTFPKGKIGESGLSLQANAIRECYEESGLKARITGYLGDFKRTTSTTRLYLGERIGGDPTAMGWKSQAVYLVPKSDLEEYLKNSADLPVLEKLSACGPSISVKDIIAYEFGLTSGHRVLATISCYRRRFHQWPTRILMPEEMAKAIKEGVLTALGWRMLNNKVTIVPCDLSTLYAEGSEGRVEYGDHTHLSDIGEERPDVWIWGINLTANS